MVELEHLRVSSPMLLGWASGGLQKASHGRLAAIPGGRGGGRGRREASASLNHIWQSFLDHLPASRFARVSKKKNKQTKKQKTNNSNKNRMPELNLNFGYTTKILL